MDERIARHEIIWGEPNKTLGAQVEREEKNRDYIDGDWREVIPKPVKNATKKYIKRNGIAILLVAAFFMQAWIVEGLTERRVTKEVTAQLRLEFQDELIRLEKERQAALILPEDVQREKEIADLASYLGEHAAGLGMDRHVSRDGIMTYLWVDCARLAQQFRGKTTIQEILTDPNQIECYTAGHATTSEYRSMAEQVARNYMTGNWPDDFTADLIYANINSDGSVTARNDWQTGSNTYTWRYKGK